MNDPGLNALLSIPGIVIQPSATAGYVSNLTDSDKFLLPEHHRQFLQISDGVAAYGGYFRLLAITGQAVPPGGWLDMPAGANGAAGGGLGHIIGEEIEMITVDGEIHDRTGVHFTGSITGS